MNEPTYGQIEFVRSLQKRLHLSDRLLDGHCVRTYGVPFAALNRSQVSGLLDEMQAWKDIPAHLQRAMGQLDMFGATP